MAPTSETRVLAMDSTKSGPPVPQPHPLSPVIFNKSDINLRPTRCGHFFTAPNQMRYLPCH